MDNILFKDLKNSTIGEFSAVCKVVAIERSRIGVILSLNDGTADKRFLIFTSSPLSSSNLQKDDIVSIGYRVENPSGPREVLPVLKQLKVLEGAEKEKALVFISSNLSSLTAPENPEFLASSDVLEKLRPRFSEAARLVLTSLLESRKIIVRHHCDCDGYCGAIALEKAILPLIRNKRERYRLFRRSPSRTPFYDYYDATRDLSFYLEEKERFDALPPLMIVVDNGSSSEDILGLQKIRLLGFKVIVIDHHFPVNLQDDDIMTDTHVNMHINPYLVGGDNNITAGMLCAEFSRFINKDVLNLQLPAALSGITDKSTSPLQQAYLKLCADIGYDEALLRKMGACIDFEAFFSKSFDCRGFIDIMLGNDLENAKQVVDMLYPGIERVHSSRARILEEKAKKKVFGKNALYIVDIEKLLPRNSYPASGKSLGILFENVKTKHDAVVVLGLRSDGIGFRMSRFSGFNLNMMIKGLQEKFPLSGVSGGGHENAGSLVFIEEDRDIIVDEVLRRMEAVLGAV